MKHGSLFSGIGGFDLAAEWMGWENVFHCEWNEFGKKVLKKNFPKSISYGDITKTDFTIHRGQINVLSGGFPCQDISHVNTNAKGIKGERSGLWSHYARAIGEIRPDFIVFENSPMLISRGLELVLSDLSRMGYDTEWRMFYASEFGFPHHRKRLYGLSYASSLGCKSYDVQAGAIHRIVPNKNEERGYKVNPFHVSLPLKRFNKQSDFGSVHLYDGFSKGMDKDSIIGFGNAIVPKIALEVFKVIDQLNSDKK